MAAVNPSPPSANVKLAVASMKGALVIDIWDADSAFS
jgi:hypothetical protein